MKENNTIKINNNTFYKIIYKLKSYFQKLSRKKDLHKINEMIRIYSKIPELNCLENCGKCCGLVSMSKYEEKRIRYFLKENNLEIKFYNDPLDVTYLNALLGDNKCYFLNDKNKCLIYPVRPIICRLYGVTENMKCPYIKPKKYLTEQEAYKLIKEIKDL